MTSVGPHALEFPKTSPDDLAENHIKPGATMTAHCAFSRRRCLAHVPCSCGQNLCGCSKISRLALPFETRPNRS